MSRRLTCNCCGRPAGTFRQWWNRDNGFGQCGACTDNGLANGESLEHIKDMAGEPGTHRPQGRLESLIRAEWPEWDNLSGGGRRELMRLYHAGKQAARDGESVKPWAGRPCPYDSREGRLWRAGYAAIAGVE